MLCDKDADMSPGVTQYDSFAEAVDLELPVKLRPALKLYITLWQTGHQTKRCQ